MSKVYIVKRYETVIAICFDYQLAEEMRNEDKKNNPDSEYVIEGITCFVESL